MEYPTMVYKNNRNNNYIANCMTTNICGFGKTEEDAVDNLRATLCNTTNSFDVKIKRIYNLTMSKRTVN